MGDTPEMDRLHNSEQKPFSEIEHIAISIKTVDQDQRHIGMLHRDTDSKQILMLHLACHHRLNKNVPDASYLWVDPAINSRRLRQVAAICRKIWRANQDGGIPYALSPPNDCFDADTGKFLLGPTRLGLTCATFVLATFHCAGLPIVNYDTWPLGRSEDIAWQEKIIAQLETHHASTEHVAAVREEIGSVRFRPEEIAGAATTPNLPVDFEVASAQALKILGLLDAS